MSLELGLRLLQLFAEGGGAEGAGAGVGAEGAPAADAGQQTGVGAQGAPAADAGQAEEETFAGLIQGKYKKDFERETSKIVRSRVANLEKENERLAKDGEQWAGIGRWLQTRYAKEGEQLSAQELMQRIEADDYFLEAEADKNGVTPDQQRALLRERFTAEDEHRELERYRQENAEREFFSQLVEQSQGLTDRYPDFDLRAEIRNPQFTQLVRYGVPVQQVYEMLHHGELIEQAQRGAAEAARAQTAASVASGGSRVAENGLGRTAQSVQKVDPSKFSDDQMDKIREAVARGERVGPGHPLWR